MVQNTLRWLEAVWSWLLESLTPLGTVLLFVALVPVLVALVRLVLERDGLAQSRAWIARIIPRALAWVPLAALIAVGFGLVGVAREAVLLRLDSQSHAAFSRGEDPPGGPTVQLNPKVTYTQEARYTRSIKIPNDVLKRFDQDGPEVLQGFIAPYLAEPQSRNVRRYLDSIVRNGRSIYLVRESSILEERQIELQQASVTVNFSPAQTASGRTYYRAQFEGVYGFQNPFPEARAVRLRFGLPQNAGTLEDFEFRVGNETASRPSVNDEFVWERELQPAERVQITVKYRSQGSATWAYRFGAAREPVRAFNLTVNAPGDVKFLRGGLYPASQQPPRYTWTLKDVITAQGVVIGFSDSSLRETLLKVFSFMPLSLPLMVAWVLALAWRRGLRLPPYEVFIGSLGFALSLALTGVLIGYMPVWLACALGFMLASSLGLLSLGWGFVLPVVCSALTPFAFLWVGNAGLVIGLIAVVLILSLLPQDILSRWRGRPRMASGS